jgi:adenylate kinase family enzyme
MQSAKMIFRQLSRLHFILNLKKGIMRIIIFGASGSGTTTLGRSLAEKLAWTFLDADDYYWEKTSPPFQIKIEKEIRNNNLKKDFNSNENVIISGSLVTWSPYWNSAFDLGIFLRIPKAVRMQRLRKREAQRYGDKLMSDQEIIKQSEVFLHWASQYDNEKFEGRSISQHKYWIKSVDFKVFELNGNIANTELVRLVLDKIKEVSKC